MYIYFLFFNCVFRKRNRNLTGTLDRSNKGPNWNGIDNVGMTKDKNLQCYGYASLTSPLWTGKSTKLWMWVRSHSVAKCALIVEDNVFTVHKPLILGLTVASEYHSTWFHELQNEVEIESITSNTWRDTFIRNHTAESYFLHDSQEK